MYVIKQLPEDFLVKELGSPQPSGSGPYAYFVLHKRVWNTVDALGSIGATLDIPLTQFGWAGNKDKQAVTEQVCSVRNVTKDKLEKVAIKDITLTYLGQGNRPVALSTHAGNAFTIVIRNLDSKPRFQERFVNLFGEQRFSKHNVAIGRAIVKRDFGTAVDHLAHDSRRGKAIQEALDTHPNDWRKALGHVPLTLLKLFVHAYQSHLWNAAANTVAKEGKQCELPIVGFGTTQEELAQLPLMHEQLKKESITVRDFVIKEFPQLSAEGSTRLLFVNAQALHVGTPEGDELNKGKKKITVSFELPNGSYATEFVRQSVGTL